MLSESKRNYIVQAAADFVLEEVDPDPNAIATDEEFDCFESTVNQMLEFIKENGIEEFQKTSWDVGYDY